MPHHQQKYNILVDQYFTMHEKPKLCTWLFVSGYGNICMHGNYLYYCEIPPTTVVSYKKTIKAVNTNNDNIKVKDKLFCVWYPSGYKTKVLRTIIDSYIQMHSTRIPWHWVAILCTKSAKHKGIKCRYIACIICNVAIQLIWGANYT